MASFKLSGLGAVTSTANDSLLYVADTADSGSTYTSKRITVSNFLNGYATQSYVTQQINNLVDGAPTALDTLNELAAAINDDSSIASSLTTLINANETHIDNTATLTGVAKDSTALGTFTGSTIADDVTIKVALQTLETAVENNTLPGLTSTVSELNILDGVTATTAEINLLDGVTATTAELNFVDGVTSNIQTQLDTKATTTALNSHITTATAKHTDIDDLVTLSGVAENGTDLGTFTGGVIADSSTIKAALQALETSVETKAASTVVTEIDVNVDDVIALTGIAENTRNLGEFTGATIDDDVTIKAALQALETAVESAGSATSLNAVVQDASDLQTLTGIADGSSDLGTFTGSTISDTTDIKTALQELETAVEAAEAGSVKVQAVASATNANHYITFVDSNNVSAEDESIYTDAGIYYNPFLNQFNANGVNTGVLSLNSVDVTATAAELNILDGVTSSTAEINILDGVTATTDEINILSGVTSTASELNLLDGVTSTTSELNILDGVTATTNEINILSGVTSSAAELNILDGVTATAAEINHLSGVGSNIQTQIDGKQATLTGLTSTVAELNILDGVTAEAAELNILDGVTATTAELNYVDGVTSAIQTQIDGKVATGANVNTLVGSTSAQTVPVDGQGDDNYLFLVVDKSDGSLKAITKTFLEIEG